MSEPLVVLLILALAALIAVVVAPRRPLAPEPDPAKSYADAVERFRAYCEVEAEGVSDLANSRLLTHGRRTEQAFALIHGLTNSPYQMLELGDLLYERGHNVLILRMPRHGLTGGNVGRLAALDGQEMRRYAEAAADLAAGLGQQVTVVGISGGATVGAWLAQFRAETIEKALLIAPFFGLHGFPDVVNTVAMHLVEVLPNINLRRASEAERPWVYRGQSTRGVLAVMKLARAARQAARDGLAPCREIMVITTGAENTASNSRTDELARLWRAAGAQVTVFDFASALGIPHNALDPSVASEARQTMLDKVMELLGEQAWETSNTATTR